MSGESENLKSVSSEVKQTENDDGKSENVQPVTDEKDASDEADSGKEVNSKTNQNSVDSEKNNDERVDAKSHKSDDEDNGSDEDKDDEKAGDKKDIKSSSPPSDVEKDNETPSKDGNKSASKSESPVEKQTARDKKKANKVTDDSADSNEVKTDIPVGRGTQLGDIPRVDASISRFKNDDLKLLHRLLYKTPGKTTLIKKNINKFNGFDFTKSTEEYDKKIAFAKKFELKQLKIICEMLDLDKKGAKEEIIERVMEFLLEPKDSGKAVGGGRPKRTAAVRANNRGYSSHDDSYSSDERRVYRGGRGKGRRTNLKDDTTSESDEEFHPSDTSETKSRGTKRKAAGGRKKQEFDEEDDDDESMTSEDSDDEPRKRKKNKKVVQVNSKSRGRPRGSGRKAPVETEKKTSPAKKPSNKRSKESSESEPEDAVTSSSEDEPLIKKAKSAQPPTDDEIRKYVKEILDGANLEEITMKTVCKQVYAHYPDYDLVCKKEFIKQTVKSLIST